MLVERYGANPVPASARTQGWFTLFAMYAGVNICLPMIMVGSVFVQTLSLTQILIVGLLGNAIAASLFSLASYPGTEHGLPAPVLTRISLGYPIGTQVASAVIVATMVGWFAVQAELAGTAADGILKQITGHSQATAMILLIGATNVFFAVAGFGWMRKLAIAAVPALILLSIVLFFRIAHTQSLASLFARPGQGPGAFVVALNLMISGQIGASFTASDISRYAKGHTSVWTGVMLGVAPVATFMILLGALATASTGESNPVLAVEALGFGIWALLLIVLATFTTNDKNLYSGGLALTNMFPGIARWIHTLILGVLGTTLACLRITKYFTNWLLALGVVFSPLVGILLTDYFIVHRRKIRISDLELDSRHYRFSGGLNLMAAVAIVAGICAAELTPPRFLQPLVSLAVTGAVYVAGMSFRHVTPELSKEPK